MILWDYIKDMMLRHPTQRVEEGDASMTYEELVVYAELFAKKLKGEKCCAIYCCSEMAASMALLGCFAAGVTAVPLSNRYGEKHCKKIIETISPTAIITDVDNELCVKHLDDGKYKEPESHPALIMCTSGTTGVPKGAMLSEKNVLTNVKDICSYFELRENDSILIARPLYHCAVLTGEYLTALVKGTKIRFHSGIFQPHLLLRLIREHKITVFCGTPTLFGLLTRFLKQIPVTLRVMAISGECMSSETGKKIRESFPFTKIYHVYGLTEACPRVSFLPPDSFEDHSDCVGIPLKSVEIQIRGKNGRTLKRGKEGILWVRGDNVMMGYYNSKKQTNKVLRNGWLCTGDIAVITDKGWLKIKGRKDDLIIRSGMNIYPQEIEDELKKDPRTEDVLVYGFKEADTMQIGLKITGDFGSVNEIKKLCVIMLPSYQVPKKIELVKELPRNGSGKIIRGV